MPPNLKIILSRDMIILLCLISISNLKTLRFEAFISVNVLKQDVLKPDVLQTWRFETGRFETGRFETGRVETGRFEK